MHAIFALPAQQLTPIQDLQPPSSPMGSNLREATGQHGWQLG